MPIPSDSIAGEFLSPIGCEYGGVYRLLSHYLYIGVYTGVGRFEGIREKFGNILLTTEKHWDFNGTATVISPIGINISHVLDDRNLLLDTLETIEYEWLLLEKPEVAEIFGMFMAIRSDIEKHRWPIMCDEIPVPWDGERDGRGDYYVSVPLVYIAEAFPYINVRDVLNYAWRFGGYVGMDTRSVFFDYPLSKAPGQ